MSTPPLPPSPFLWWNSRCVAPPPSAPHIPWILMPVSAQLKLLSGTLFSADTSCLWCKSVSVRVLLGSHPAVFSVVRRRWPTGWRSGGRPWARCAVPPSWPCASSSCRSPSPGSAPSWKWWEPFWPSENRFSKEEWGGLFNGGLLSFSTVSCAKRGTTRTSCCCVTAVIKAATPTVTNPRSPASLKETGTAPPASPR